MRSLVSKLIQERRESEGWTQADLADRVGVTRNTINHWEIGSHEPTQPQQRQLAQTLSGIPNEYKWTERDYEHHVWRMKMWGESLRLP